MRNSCHNDNFTSRELTCESHLFEVSQGIEQKSWNRRSLRAYPADSSWPLCNSHSILMIQS